jgi:hypothetical protein
LVKAPDVTEEEFMTSVSDELDRRREAVTRVKRVVAHVRGTTIEQTASVMAIPMLYAHWEGYVKQTVGTYVEFIESQAMLPHEANAGIFAFSIKKKIRTLIANQSASKMAEFAGWLLEEMYHLTVLLHFAKLSASMSELSKTRRKRSMRSSINGIISPILVETRNSTRMM